MFTRIKEVASDKVTITSAAENVQVTVERIDGGFPNGPLTRQETHDALAKVETETTEFLACVEADLHGIELG